MKEAKELQALAAKIYEIATAHGWHDTKNSARHYLCLVMTEVAEAVEADRKHKHALMEMFNANVNTPQPENRKVEHWKFCFETFVKNSIEDEFADIVIRLLDMANAIHGEKMRWLGYFDDYDDARDILPEGLSFPETAWYFVDEILNWGMMNITDSISFMYGWAHHLGIDLDRHIELKMKYNDLRPYKHGGKKY